MALRSFAILSAFASAILAQSTNPFVPSGISASCSSYLSYLNDDTDFTACTSPFTTALAAFAPGNASPSAATITSALGQLCQSNAFNSCPQNIVAAQLAAFYGNCSEELTSNPNTNVKTTYDVLYSLVPLRLSLCAKDDNSDYCATELSNSSGTGSDDYVQPQGSQKQSLLSQYLYYSPGTGTPARRDVSNTTTALVPNTTTYSDTNLVFMFLNGDMSNAQLCTTCTRNIFAPYIMFGSSCPYAPGLNNSLLFVNQLPLYNSIVSECGQSFLSGAVQAAGGISSGLISGAAPLAVGQELSAALSAILGVVAFVAAL